MSILPFIVLVTFCFISSEGRIIAFNPEDNKKLLEIDENEIWSGQESIDLSGMGLTKISGGFIESNSIRSLTLENNSITDIHPNAFDKATNLLHLNLAYNRLAFDKLYSFDHPTIKTFNLSYQLDSADSEIETLKSEKYTTVHSIFDSMMLRFPNLEHLDLSGIQFSYLSKYMNISFPKLTHFYLNDRPVVYLYQQLFDDLPPTVTHLYLRRNSFTEVDISNAANVVALYLDGNRLESVALKSSNIKLLSLVNCNLGSLDSVFLMYLPNIINLDLSMNSIKEISEDTFAYVLELEHLSLSHNKLYKFPDVRNLHRLKSLSLSYNNINNGILYEIPYLPSLTKLSLRGNRISEINNYAFSRLPKLEELDLGENYLKWLPLRWADSMKLKYLDLSSNEFMRITDMNINITSNLRDLLIKGNEITRIHENDLKLLPPSCIIHVI